MEDNYEIIPDEFVDSNNHFYYCDKYKIPLVTIFKKNKKKYCNVELDCITALPYHTLKNNIIDDFYPQKYEALLGRFPIDEKWQKFQGGILTVFFKTKIEYSEEIARYLHDYGVEFVKQNRVLSLERIILRFRNFINNEYLRNTKLEAVDKNLIAFWRSGIPENVITKHFPELREYLSNSLYDSPLELFNSAVNFINCDPEKQIDVYTY